MKKQSMKSLQRRRLLGSLSLEKTQQLKRLSARKTVPPSVLRFTSLTIQPG
ncbi:UNVERIFIED_CONTAM: hypothetical protein GTU68_031535 [Idotea baltica]|nr:hypothetical protein [Idotea baltica]